MSEKIQISKINLNNGQLEGVPKNPRFIRDGKFELLKKSIEEDPEMIELRELIVVPLDDKYVCIAGNMRLRALRELGYKEAPCKVIDYDDKKLRAIATKDNMPYGDWDWDLIANEWDTDELEEWGFEFPEDVEEEEIHLEAGEDNYEEPDNMQVDVELGDLIEIGEHRLLCGDSTDSDAVAKLMNGEKGDMVFTDPPYGVSYEGGHNKKKRDGIENDTLEGIDLTNLFRDSLMNADIFSYSHSAFYIWYANGKAVETFKSFSELNLEVRAVICWYKVKSGLGAFMSQYIPNYEPCIYAYKKGCSPQWFGASDEKTVWELKKESKNQYHPTQKPIELPERAIRNSSKINDVVYDCFLGSGSTMVAAHQLNRRCYGMELDPKYCQVIIDRMKKLDPSIEVKINGQAYEPKEITE